MSEVKRRQIQCAILKWMYEKLLQCASMWSLPGDGDIAGFDWADVQYELRRLDGDGFISGNHLKRITARGIDYLQDLGVETLLAGDSRERVLAALYDTDRRQGPNARVNTKSLAESLSESEIAIGVVLHYLEDSGLIDVQGTLADRFWGVRINPRGMAKHEAMQAAGSGWASLTTSPTDGHEFVFGPNEEKEAARLLRDVTEVARSQLLIVDPYARAGIISRLGYVPKGVKIMVLTSDGMSGEDYQTELQAHPHLDIEIRVLPKATLQFHDRYVIVDENDAWGWGHSFHDAGKTKHTVAQIRPVNRDRIIADFQTKWQAGKVVV
jgi:hypothetical protein